MSGRGLSLDFDGTGCLAFDSFSRPERSRDSLRFQPFGFDISVVTIFRFFRVEKYVFLQCCESHIDNIGTTAVVCEYIFGI